MDKKVSIIIPVYNVAEYLKECLDSVINQTYKNLEILLINDGSTDNSLEICKEYSNRDSRVKVFDIKNGGVSNARNIGIVNATGEYLSFIDGDDFVSENYIEKLYDQAIASGKDMTICRMNLYEDGKVTPTKENFAPLFAEEPDDKAKTYLCLNSSVMGSSWRILYKTEFLVKNDIKFNVNLKFCEDMAFVLKCIYMGATFAEVNEYMYFYRQNPSSYIKTYKPDFLKAEQDFYDYVTEFVKNEDYKEQLVFKLVYMAFGEESVKNPKYEKNKLQEIYKSKLYKQFKLNVISKYKVKSKRIIVCSILIKLHCGRLIRFFMNI